MADIPVRLLFAMTGLNDFMKGSASMKEMATAARGIQKELDTLEKQLHKVRVAQHEWSFSHAQANPRLAETEQRLLAQRAALEGQSTALSKSAQATQMLGMAWAAAGAAMVKAIQEMVQAAMEYESTMAKIEVLTGTSREQTAAWSQELMDLGPELGKGPQELAEGLYFLASSGLKGQEAMEALKVSAKASSVGMGETKDIAQALVAVMNSYKDSNLTAAQAGDILIATVREGGAEADQLAGSIGRVAAVAANAGIPLEEVGAYIATFTRVIPSSAEAVTSLRAAILNLTAPSSETRKELTALGLSADDVRQSIKDKGLMATLADLIKVTDGNLDSLDKLIPNVRALAGVMATAGAQGTSYKDVLASIQNSHGDLDRAFERTKETASFQWEAAKAEAEALAITIGAQLLPVLRDVLNVAKPLAEGIRDLVGVFDKLPEPIQRAIGALNMFKQLAIALDPGAGIRAQAAQDLEMASADYVRLMAVRATNEEMYNSVIAKGIAQRQEKQQKATDEEIKAAKKAAEEIRKIRADMMGDSAQKDVDNLAKAMAGVDLVTQLSAKSMDELKNKLTAAVESGAKLPPVFKGLGVEEAIAAKNAAAYSKASMEYHNFQVDALDIQIKLWAAMNGQTEEVARVLFLGESAARKFVETGLTQEQVNQKLMDTENLLTDMQQEFLQIAAAMGDPIAQMQLMYQEAERTKHVQGDAKKETIDWAGKVRDLASAFEVLGIKSDSALGQIMGGIAGGMASFKDLGKSVDLIGKGGFENIANGILGGITSGLQTVGAAIQIGKAIHGLFTKSPAERAAEESGKYLGAKVSDAMAEELAKDMEKFGIGAREALMLNLTKAADDLGKPLSSMRTQIGDLMNAVKLGAVPAKEGVAELGRAFTQLGEEAAAGSKDAEAAMREMVLRSRELGLEIPEIAAFVKEALGTAVEGLNKRVAAFADTVDRSGLSLGEQAQRLSRYEQKLKDAGVAEDELKRLVAERSHELDRAGQVTEETQAGFDRMGQFTLATFGAIVAETGNVVQALEEVGPSIDTLAELQANFGFQASASLQPLIAMRAVLADNQDIADGLEGLQQLLKGLADSGYMTADVFQAVGADAGSMYDEMIGRGVDANTAMLLMQPTLQQLWEAQKDYGAVTDETTAKLLQQAEEQGLVGEQQRDVNERILDVLLAIGQALGANVEQFERTADVVENQMGGRATEAVLDVEQAITEDLQAAMDGLTVEGSEAVFDDFAMAGVAAADEVQAALDAISMPAIDLPVWDDEPGQYNPHHGGGGGGAPGAATGAMVAPRPGGSLYNVGEGGQAEVIAPVAAFMSDLRRAIVNDVVERVGSGHGGQPVVIVNVDGKEAIGTVVQTMLNNGYLTVPRAAVV